MTYHNKEYHSTDKWVYEWMYLKNHSHWFYTNNDTMNWPLRAKSQHCWTSFTICESRGLQRSSKLINCKLFYRWCQSWFSQICLRVLEDSPVKSDINLRLCLVGKLLSIIIGFGFPVSSCLAFLFLKTRYTTSLIL